MQYADVRPQIKTGDLLAWSHGGWRTWHDIQVSFVRIFTRSEFSHVGLAWVANGRVFILEAVGSGVRIYPLSRELPFYWVPKPFRLSRNAVNFAFAHIGDAYSKFQAKLAGLGLLQKGDDDVWQCAEFVLSILAQDRWPLDDVDATPTAVVKAAMQHWGALRYVE